MAQTEPRMLELREHQGENGALLPFNFADLPFAPRHAFYVRGVPVGEVRGRHAHRSCEQLLFAISGSISVSTDDGDEKRKFLLNQPTQGLFLPKMVWGEQEYRDEESALLVFASEPYAAERYIEDFDTFLELRSLWR